ncbi:unnamed protein product, partial [Sphagnum compactum]
MIPQKMWITVRWCLALEGGCAQTPTQEPDHLSKLRRQTERNEQLNQEKQFERIVKDERTEQKSRTSKQFPLPKILTEEALYTEIIRAYQTRQIDAVSHYTGEFLQRYPNSVFADSALYLRGELSLIMGFTAEALRDFEQIVDDYPAGKKYVAALYGKAVCYRKLQLYNYAEQALNDLNKSFPGSPESVKVPLEQRMLQAER